MQSPSNNTLFDVLDGGYALGLLLLFPLAALPDPSRGALIRAFGPVALTMLLFVGQVLITRREEAATAAGHPSGAKAGHAWGGFLLLYIVVTLLAVGINGALSNLH